MVTKGRVTREGKEPKRFTLPCCFGNAQASVSRILPSLLLLNLEMIHARQNGQRAARRVSYCRRVETNMSSSFARAALPLALAILCFLAGGAESARVFTIINRCKTTIWPAASPGNSFGGGGFALRPGQSMVFTAPVAWSGRIWGRTECNFDASGNGSCATGRCGTSLKCGASGEPPASLAEFTLAAKDFYDVSLVDGFNLPMVVKPVNGQGNCSAAGCDGDLRDNCPSELAVKVNGRTVACRSACDVFDTDQYCCRGQFGNPSTCQPTFYSKKFKAACPTAYSYAYDDPTSIFTCSNADYIITFCSSRKQPVCSYHNNRLVCSGSGRSWPVMSTWIMLALLFSFWSLQFYLADVQ